MKIVKIIPLLVCFLISACSLGTVQVPVDLSRANMLWEQFEDHSNSAFNFAESISLSGSLRFGTAEGTRRVTYILWARAEELLRMDISAGIGVNILKMQEDFSKLLLYTPQEEKAYLYLGNTENALESFGIPLPFSLLDLSSFLFGNYLTPFHDIQMKSVTHTEEGLWNFAFISREMEGNIFLNDQAMPERMEIIQAENTWLLELSHRDSMLSQVRIEDAQGYHMVILLKERKHEQKGEVLFTEEAMRLSLPEETSIILLP